MGFADYLPTIEIFLGGPEKKNHIKSVIYSDRSGLFDKVHNDKFGGLIFLDKQSKDVYFRQYLSDEKAIYFSGLIKNEKKIKAARISKRLYRAV
ncbi:MAG: hypothetical protein ACI4RG_07885 [Huintestinicola sp.]